MRKKIKGSDGAQSGANSTGAGKRALGIRGLPASTQVDSKGHQKSRELDILHTLHANKNGRLN